jgi:hypothetical protein
MTFYLASAHDAPHRPHPYIPDMTACKLPTGGMREITDVQAQVWLRNRRCAACAVHLDKLNRGNR